MVSGLVLNFLPDLPAAVGGMRDRLRSGGVVAAYVWDYADGMQLLRCFWQAAVDIDPAAVPLDEGKRFPINTQSALQSLFRDAGMRPVCCEALDIATRFESFADYWQPFTGGTGPAPSYVVSLGEEARTELRERLRQQLIPGPDGSIELVARAWAIRGTAA